METLGKRVAEMNKRSERIIRVHFKEGAPVAASVAPKFMFGGVAFNSPSDVVLQEGRIIKRMLPDKKLDGTS